MLDEYTKLSYMNLIKVFLDCFSKYHSLVDHLYQIFWPFKNIFKFFLRETWWTFRLKSVTYRFNISWGPLKLIFCEVPLLTIRPLNFYLTVKEY